MNKMYKINFINACNLNMAKDMANEITFVYRQIIHTRFVVLSIQSILQITNISTLYVLRNVYNGNLHRKFINRIRK